MAITIKAVEKPQPGVTGGGVKKWYASPVMEAKELTLASAKFTKI